MLTSVTMDDSGMRSRRKLLRAIAVGSTVSIAGCNSSRDSSTHSPTASSTPTPTTAVDKEPPNINAFDATPEDSGTALAVSMRVTDDRELATATIEYGDREVEIALDGTESQIEERLQDIAVGASVDAEAVRTRVFDAAGNKTEATADPDSTVPSLSITPKIATSAGTLLFEMAADDNAGLHTLHVQANGETILKTSVTGRRSISREMHLDVTESESATVGEPNRIRVTITDTFGNSTHKEYDQYIRKYDEMEDTRLALVGNYMPMAGGAMTYHMEEGVDTEPAVGLYGRPIPPEITSRHIDQMTGFGFDVVGYDFGGMGQKQWAEAFLKSEMIDEVEIFPTFIKPVFGRAMDESWKNEILPRNCSFLTEHFLTRDNALTIDGRPVLDTWDWRSLAVKDEKRNKLLDEFGSFEGFADAVRKELRTERGDPYILFGIGSAGAHLEKESHRHVRELAKQFDALRTWFHGTRGGWDAVVDRAIADFEGSRAFAEQHDMEFIPIARPGYDERWDTHEYRTTDRYLPRDPERFRQLLQIADKYRTTDRIMVPFNDWIEGHTIEPGTFTGTEFGTTYLEVVEEFQRPDN